MLNRVNHAAFFVGFGLKNCNAGFWGVHRFGLFEQALKAVAPTRLLDASQLFDSSMFGGRFLAHGNDYFCFSLLMFFTELISLLHWHGCKFGGWSRFHFLGCVCSAAKQTDWLVIQDPVAPATPGTDRNCPATRGLEDLRYMHN